MNCFECGSEFVSVTETLVWKTNFVGVIKIPDASFRKCLGCGEELLPPDLCELISEAEKRREREMVDDYPRREFLTAQETADVLGITKQALHKHRRIAQ